MSSLPVVKQNLLTFKRLKSLNVTGYKIVVKETLEDGSINKRLLETIPNPTVPQYVLHRYPLEYRRSQYWDLPEDVCYDSDHKVEVFINGVQLDGMHRTYSERLRRVSIMLESPLKTSDLVEVTYYQDEITYTHTTPYRSEYFIEPVITYAYNVGNHNVLK